MISTLNRYLAALLGKPHRILDRCIVPGCTHRTANKHHAVPGRRKDPANPLIGLCGSGTTGHHGKAHERRLHFRWRTEHCGDCFPEGCPNCTHTGWWEYLETDHPAKYEKALEAQGWRPTR